MKKYIVVVLFAFVASLVMDTVQAKRKEDKTYEQMVMIKDCRGFIGYGTIVFERASDMPKILREINKSLKESYKEAMTAYREANKEFQAWIEEQKKAGKTAEKEWKEAHPDAGRNAYKEYLAKKIFDEEYEKWAEEQGDKLPEDEKKAHKAFYKWVKKNPYRHYEPGKPRKPVSPSAKAQGGRIRQPGKDDKTTKYDKYMERVTKKSEWAEKYNAQLAKKLGMEEADIDFETYFGMGAPE